MRISPGGRLCRGMSDAPLACRAKRTEQEAIDEVAKLFRIAPAVRDKLMATKVKE